MAGGLLAAVLVGAFYLLASTGLRATRGEVLEATRARLASEAGLAAGASGNSDSDYDHDENGSRAGVGVTRPQTRSKGWKSLMYSP